LKPSDFKHKKIGIWGYGITGKALTRFLTEWPISLSVLDRRELSQEESISLQRHNIKFLFENNLNDFLMHNEYIIPTPSIDLSLYTHYSAKFISELDLFFLLWRKPIIAVTGSVGKTSIVHLLSQILPKYDIKCAVGGNIGTAMFDLIKEQHTRDIALLELSSFQLEHCHLFHPTLGIWTNFSENHLDRHKTIENYFLAKAKLFLHTSVRSRFILPKNIIKFLKLFNMYDSICTQTTFLSEKPAAIYCPIIQSLPKITFEQNWYVILKILQFLNKDFQKLLSCAHQLSMPAHRLEYLATINNVLFYNDSKSTTPAATLSAVNALYQHPIILILGGVSKGINRSFFIKQLKNRVKLIVCFGKESQFLTDMTKKYEIPSYSYNTLDEATVGAYSCAQADDVVLFSPSGASFDLFKDYIERGDYFRKLVRLL